MTTTDGNGIIFLEETDPISPFHTLINTLQQGTSNVVERFQSLPFAVAAGAEGVSEPVPANGSGFVDVNITFPIGRFTAPPILIATAASSRVNCQIIGANTAGGSVRLYNWTTTAAGAANPGLFWYAIQMTASSGAG